MTCTSVIVSVCICVDSVLRTQKGTRIDVEVAVTSVLNLNTPQIINMLEDASLQLMLSDRCVPQLTLTVCVLATKVILTYTAKVTECMH